MSGNSDRAGEGPRIRVLLLEPVVLICELLKSLLAQLEPQLELITSPRLLPHLLALAPDVVVVSAAEESSAAGWQAALERVHQAFPAALIVTICEERSDQEGVKGNPPVAATLASDAGPEELVATILRVARSQPSVDASGR